MTQKCKMLHTSVLTRAGVTSLFFSHRYYLFHYDLCFFLGHSSKGSATGCEHELGFCSGSFGCDLIFCPANLIACELSSQRPSLSFRTPSHLSRSPISLSCTPTRSSSGEEQIREEVAGKLMKRIQEPQGCWQESSFPWNRVLPGRTPWLLDGHETLLNRQGLGFWQRLT